jgi:hypothetical protein
VLSHLHSISLSLRYSLIYTLSLSLSDVREKARGHMAHVCLHTSYGIFFNAYMHQCFRILLALRCYEEEDTCVI